MPDCEEIFEGVTPCSSELVTVDDPLQIILILEHEGSGFQVFLRFRSAGINAWRFDGVFAPLVKYFRPEHRSTSFGT